MLTELITLRNVLQIPAVLLPSDAHLARRVHSLSDGVPWGLGPVAHDVIARCARSSDTHDELLLVLSHLVPQKLARYELPARGEGESALEFVVRARWLEAAAILLEMEFTVDEAMAPARAPLVLALGTVIEALEDEEINSTYAPIGDPFEDDAAAAMVAVVTHAGVYRPLRLQGETMKDALQRVTPLLDPNGGAAAETAELLALWLVATVRRARDT